MKIIDVNDEVWMWMHQKYVTTQIVQKFYWVKTNNCPYLAVTGDILLNQQNNECKI